MATYSHIKDKINNREVQVESAIRDGSGKNIENNYAKQNGYYSTLDVGEADLADNLKTQQGAQVTDALAVLAPVSVAVTDGDFAKMSEFKGRSFAYNQLVNHGNFDTSQGWSNYLYTCNYSINNNECRVYNANNLDISRTLNIISGHKYLVFYQAKGNANSTATEIRLAGNAGSTGTKAITSSYQDFIKVVTSSANSDRFYVCCYGSTGNEVYFKNVQFFDLTAMGLSTVSTVDEALAALRSYGIEPTVYNEYSAGKIIDSQPNKIISRGFNQWDEETQVYYGSNLGSKNHIKVIPNATYYFKIPSLGVNTINIYYYDTNKTENGSAIITGGNVTFSIPSNACYMKFILTSSYGTTYNNDICINISDPALNGTYKPFVKDEHILELPVMRSAGSVVDDKDMVRVGSVDLGTLNWSYWDAQNEWYCIFSQKKSTSTIGLSEKYTLFNSFQNMPNNSIHIRAGENETNALYVKTDGTNQVRPSGILNYELATPTAQSPAITLPENIRVYNGGTLETEYESPNTTPGLVSMLYQVNLKNYLEGQGAREDINWNPHNVVSQEELASGLAPKADTTALENGDIIPQFSENLTPYDDESGADQDEPFSFQATGTANGTLSDFATGSIAQLKEKRGNTVVVNQLAKAVSGANYGFTNATGSFDNGIVTFTASTQYGECYQNIQNVIQGHRYYIAGYIKKTTANATVSLNFYGLSVSVQTKETTDWQFVCTIGTQGLSGVQILRVIDTRTQDFDAIQAKGIICIDLTQMFNDDIPQDLLDHPENASRYGMLGLAYNTGTLTNCNGRYLQCIGRNAFNKENATLNKIINTSGVETSVSGYFHSDYIKCIPNTNYNFKGAINWDVGGYVVWFDKNKNFITYNSTSGTMPLNVHTKSPANAEYMIMNGVSSAIDSATISLYYEGESGYDQYYPYEVLENVDTGTEELRSAGSAYDVKVPSGAITRRIGSYTFTGEETIDSTTSQRFYYTNLRTDIKPVENTVVANICCVGLLPTIKDALGSYTNVIAVDNAGNVWFRLASDTTLEQMVAFLTGKTIYYELAEPTIEQGTPFQENLDINDFGSMEFDRASDDETAFNGVPQGNLIFYPVDYKAFIDTLYDYTDGSPENLVLQEELGAESEARSATDVILQNALGGTLRQLLAATKSIDFANTAFVDLGDLTWTKGSSGNDTVYYAIVSDLQPTGSLGYETKMICTKFKTATNGTEFVPNTISGVAVFSTKNVCVKTNDYADATAFKAAMKGILLAYEKASS